MGEFGDTAKKWTLPVPTHAACNLWPNGVCRWKTRSHRRLLAKRMTPCNGAGFASLEHATDLARHIWCYSCKCQLLISKPKNEIKWILNICVRINWEYGSTDVSVKPWSCFQRILHIPLIFCLVLIHSVAAELKSIMPFSSNTSENTGWVAFLKWLLTLRSCLTDKTEITQPKFG